MLEQYGIELQSWGPDLPVSAVTAGSRSTSPRATKAARSSLSSEVDYSYLVIVKVIYQSGPLLYEVKHILCHLIVDIQPRSDL